ncbi:hypothetical protein [Leptospira haakeii]|uniref:Penicillin-binding protein n=1 Tax=Leptospira haakeii TaxID=2023198 RepID=A0ABX4PNC3_9LEPT|nr:hypothetical protein [Leptospira haakeii]PKA17297.1 hypothetical protein CH363_01200 [Leptospira haakeii]PKA21021.1 hypothetical protein CH377_01200 [Leptospira haakeii]
MRKYLYLIPVSFLFACPPPPSEDPLSSLMSTLALSNMPVPSEFTVVDSAKQAQLDAVEATATKNSTCTKLGAFYWEIGDVNGAYGYSSVNGSVNGSTVLLIASASKWIWGAYVLEKVGTPTTIEQSYLRMRSGYDNLDDNKCNLALTVNACFTNGPGRDGTNNNNYYNSGDLNYFYYNGAHFQAYAALNPSGLTPALTNYTRAQLATEIGNTLFGGSNPGIDYAVPQPAGGVRTSASIYAQFLRRILNSNLTIRTYLGADLVPTLPSVHPTQAKYSPFILEDVHYSYGHWVEDSSGNDSAYSSPGKFGFYPWIDPTVTTYGIIARYSTSGLAYAESVYCGRLLRKAFATGIEQ